MDNSSESTALVSLRAPSGPADADLDSDEVTYGSFWMGENEFLLPAVHVREVVPFPEAFAVIPLAPGYVVGLFDLRGEIVPIVCVATLLGLDAPSREPGVSRVAIIDCGEDQIGAVFSGTGEVLRACPRALQPLHHGPDETNPVVDALLSLDGGRRVLQVLSAELIAQVERIPRGPSTSSRLVVEEEVPKHRFVAVAVGTLRLALRGEDVIEIQEGLPIQAATSYYECSPGVVNLRGETIPVLELGELLQHPCSEDSLSRPLVFVHDGRSVCALLVDSILDVFEVEDDAIREVPMLRRLPTGEVCHQVVTSASGDQRMALDVAALFGRAGVHDALLENRGILDRLRPSTEETEEEFDQVSFLVFRLGEQRFGFPLSSIREIQDFPSEFLCPPGHDDRFVGMMSLRGEIVSLVDLRVRYGVEVTGAIEATKVLIVDVGTPVGFLVDQLDGIVHTTAASRVELEQWMMPRSKDSEILRQHVSSVIQQGGGALLTLDPERVVAATFTTNSLPPPRDPYLAFENS